MPILYLALRWAYIDGLHFQMHANIVLSEDVLDYAPLFAEIADAYFERELYVDARPIYELLGSDAVVRFCSSLVPIALSFSAVDKQTSSLYVLLQTAGCLRMLGELREAAEVYEHGESRTPYMSDCSLSHTPAKLKTPLQMTMTQK
jgi:general transcription factor 3C polypeptide 3 (transcription factor C subunit 4)